MTPFEGYASDALRSEGLGEPVVRAIAQCGRTPARESLAALATSFGFDGFSYLLLASSTPSRVLSHWSSCGSAWVTRYAARGYHLVDPRVTLTRHRSVPVAWDAGVAAREPHAGEFVHDAGRHEVRSGVAWSSLDARYGRAVVAWDSRRPEASSLGGRLAAVALLAGIVHEALAAHCSGLTPAPGNQALTPRELACLALVARGMTSADAGVKLGITTRTTNFHIGNVMAKLGAVSRGEAIARAVAANLISVSD